MANAWDEYKKKHGISDQPAQQAETENAWERYKRETGIESGTDIWQKKVQNRAEATKRNREAQTQERRNLYAQKREIDNFTGPQPIGGEDAMKANYYSNLNQYGAKYGDAAAQDEGYRNYRQAMANVDKAYTSEIEKNRRQDAAYDAFRQAAERVMPFKSDLSRAGRELTVQDQRYARDANLYNQMGQAANQTGSKALWDKAEQGYEQANADYMKSFNAYGEAYNDRQQKELAHLEENDHGTYVGMTTSAEEVEQRLKDLNVRKADLEVKRQALEKELNSLKMSGQVSSVDSRGVGHYGKTERDYNAAINDLAAVEAELKLYTNAKKYQDRQKGNVLYEQYFGGGKVLTPDVVRKSETGKAKYEADRKAAEQRGAETLDYGWNIVRKTRGVWRTEKDRLEEASWDPTFDDASNLNSEDRMLFYALYADDPERAMFWARYANDIRNEEYEKWMAEWAGENGVNAGAAFFQALGNRIGSGAVNLVDPHSAEANQLARTASGLLAGGGQLLNEWSGTIDTDIPIVRDILNGKGLGDFYQLANSIVESGINAYAAGKLGAFIPGGGESGIAALGVMLMGSSASAADYNECIKRGLTPGQAQKHALAAGINEALFEFVSLDKLLDEEKLMMASTVSEKIKGVFAQAGVEASEEFCTTVANRLADAAQARRDGYDTQIEQRAKELIALGLSRDEAMEKAEKEWLVDLINDAIGGFISGGGLKLGAYAVTAPARAAVNAVQNTLATNKVNEIRGSFTSAEEAQALRSFAEANGIKVSERVAQSTEENATENAPTTEQEAKLSRREIRQERRANRETGALESEVVKKLSETVHERGLNSAQEIFNEQTQQHGAAITRIVQQAIVNEARTVFAQAQNQSELTKAYQQAVETTTAKPVKQALKQAYQDATTLRAYQGDKEAMTDALIGGGSGRALDLSAELTAADGSTQQVQIKALNTKQGEIVLDNGSTVTLDELQGLDADTKDVIQRLDAFELGEARPLAFLAYQTAVEKGEVTDGTRWVMSWALAFDQGRNGAISVQEAINRSSLPADVVRKAYELGAEQTETWRRQKEAENAKKRKKAEDGATGHKGILDTSALTKEQYDSLSADKKDALSTLELIAEATGVDIRLIAQKVTKRGNVKGYQGLYNKGGNYIEIDVNAGINNIFEDLHTGMTAVLGHELTHWMQESAPTEYLAYKKAVLQAIMSTRNGELTLERMIEAQINQNKREGKEISRSQAEDEVVADASMKRMGDSEFWDAVSENLGDKKADVFAKIKEYISQFFNRVRELIGKASHTSEAARIVDRVEADVQATLRRLYAEGIGAAMRNSAQIVRDAEILGASEQMIEDAATQYSSRIDDETLQFLDNQEHVTVYRAMQVIDGKLYPPMAAKVEGKLVEPTEIGKWYQSVERPDLVKNGKFTLNKGNGTSVPAAYNPYFHCSASPLNDQFSSAYKRPNLVVVEGIIPKSELTSGYRAEGAKNSVGETTWHAGPVASKLKGNKARRVFLSRWFQVQRIMTDAEVAGIVAKTLEGENVSVPSNVVTPGLLKALRSEGVQIDETGIQRQSRKNAAQEAPSVNTPGENNDSFSLRSPVEQTDRLIAWHNMSEEALRSALELGGLAMPSWAIKTADKAHTSYGDISVIAPRSLVDPKLNQNSMIFGGDAWTPVFPDVNYKISSDAVDALTDEIESLIGKEALRDLGGAALDETNIADQFSKHGGAVSNYYKRNQALRYAYLKSIGQDIELPKTAKRLDDSGKYENDAVENFASRLVNGKKSLDYYRKMSSKELMQDQDLKKAITDTMVTMYGEEVRDAYAPEELSFRDIDAMLYAANKYFTEGIREEVDSRAVGKEIDKVIDEAAYEKWIRDKLNSTIERKGIRNNKDPFTPSGKRRSFDELNYAYNLANIVNAMKAQPKQGRTQFLSGPGSVKGAALKNYSTVEQVRADRGRLVNTAEEGKAAYDAYNDNLADILDRMSKTGDRFDTADALIEILQHAKTEDAIYRYMERELKDWYNVSREMAHDIYKLIGQINELPMEYFEGKTYDAVGFDETAAVVVPDTISADLKKQLVNAGANVIEYKAGDNEDRLEKVNSAENVQFSTRDYSDTSDLDLLLNAADEISEGGGEDYWASLLSEEPGLANETEEIKRLGKQLKKTAAELAEAQRNLTLTDRKLKTRGIASLAATIMQDQKAGDINKKDVQKRITAVLTEAYQKALDQLDAGADVGSAWETVYSEGVVKAADILLTDATYAEKLGYKWYKNTLGAYLGEGAREYVEADIGARVAEDFQANRYRPGQKGTIADRLVAQAENRVNRKLDAAKTENAALKAENAKLTEDKAFFEAQAKSAKETAGELYQQLLDKREELKNNTKISAEERKKTLKKLDNLQKQMQAKRKEAQAWKEKAQGEAKKVNQAIREKEAAVAKLEKQLQRERDILEGKLKPPAIQKMLAAAREREGKRIAEQKDERFAKYKEKQSAAQLRSRIKNLSDEMKRKMTRPTDGSYVPASLYGSMTQVADLLDNALAPKAGTKAEAKYRAMMDAIHALQSEYGKVAEMDDYTYKSEFDTAIMDEIKELEEVLTKDQSWIMRETGDNRSLREYSLGDLTRIYEILRTINESMTSAAHFLGKANFQSIWDAMGQIAEQQGDMTSFNRLGWYGKKKRMRMLDSLNVMRAVEMMSGWDRSAALYRIMQQVENGVDVSNAWMMEYNKAMQALKTGKNEKAYRDALTKKLDFNVTDEEGLPVLMTKMQALQLLMTAEREAHNDKLVHLQRGGATIRDALAIQDGKKDAAAQTIKVTPELIQRIQNSLSDWDKAYMKAVRNYFGREGKATNRVLYNLKHRVLQTEDYYVPYNVDKNYLDTDLNETQAMNMWVKTPGSTNALQKKASQPVIIDGMDTVMAKHVREIADYIGLAIPIRDFAKVYNGRLKQGEGENPLPVKQTIDKNWKAKGQHLLTQSIIDVQGGSRGASWATAIADHLNALQSAFVKSALLVNPSVTIKQAASYAAAGSILSHAALDRANHPISVKTDESNAFDPATGLIGHIFFAPNGATAMRIYNEIDKYTSLHYMRRQGMSQAELANEANRSGKLKRAMNSVGASMEQTTAGHIARKVGASLNPVSWIQRMDVATTATLWLACKEQARMDGMKVGTDEYWQHVTELYERVIRETQPMYDSLHRNAGQKSRETSLMQYLFPFRTVPIQNHGQIAASYETLQAALKSKDEARIKEAKKFFAKTMWAQTESAIIFSLMSFIAAALKRKTKKYRDEDEEISLESILQGLGRDTAGTMVSNLFPLLGSTVWDQMGNIYDAARTGKKVWSYDTFSVGAVDMLNDAAKAIGTIGTDVANLFAGNDVSWDQVSKDIQDLLVKSMKCLGIPASTIKTYAEGMIGNVNDVLEGRIPALNDASWERSAAVNANRYLKAWIADDDAKLETVKAEMMGNYKEAGKDEEEANKAMKTKLTATAKDAFAAGTLDETDAILFLAETGYYDENEAWNKVRQWAAENEHEGDEEYKWNQYEDLRAAFTAGSGIEEAIKELEDHGYSDTQLANEIADNIRGALTTGAISEETAIDYLKRYRGMDEDKAWKKVQEWKAKAEHADEEDYSYSQYDAIDAAIDANKEIKDLVSELTAHGVKAESITSHVKQHLVENYVNGSVSETALRNQLSRYCGIVAKDDVDKIVNDAKCRKDTGYAYSALDEAYRSGEVSKTTMKNALVKYGGKTSEEADKKLRWWDLQVSKPSLEISESTANAWYDGTAKSRENGHESAKAAGMSIEAYLKAKAVLDEIKDANDNGSGEDEVIAALAKMNLTARQKDALYYERYKGTTKISKTKSW